MKFLKLQKITRNIIYPQDVLVGKNIKDISRVKEVDEILDDDLILDIGPNTINN